MAYTKQQFSHSTSIWLDLLRGVSAQLVLLGHLQLLDALTVAPYSLPDIQTIAVIVFYILSGFLITRSIRHKLHVHGYDFGSFFIDRFSRIYPAYFGTLCFVAIADWFYIENYPEGYETHGYRYRFVTFIANIFFLEKINLRQGTFGSASQLWSLPPEWWLYMVAGYIAFAARSHNFLSSKTSFVLLLVFLYAPVWFLFRGNPGSGTGIVAIWILGCFAYIVYDYLALREITRPQTRLVSLLCLIFFSTALIRYRLTHDGYDLLAGFDLTMAFLCSVWLSQTAVFGFLRHINVQRLSRLLAFYSYSLYLTHYTIIMLSNEIGVPSMVTWIICNVFAFGFAWTFEKRHKALAQALHGFRRDNSGWRLNMRIPPLRWFVLALALTPFLALCVPQYREKAMAFVVDEIPSLYPYYQQGIQNEVGTPLSFPNTETLFVALSSPKYSENGNSRVYLIGSDRGGNYNVVAQSPSLPKEADPQGVAVFKNELLIANHQERSTSIAIYDLGAAFSGELKEIGRIPNLPSPTSVMVHGNKLFVTCYGRYSMRGQGIYVYEKDDSGAWKQIQRFLYRDLFGRTTLSQDYSKWPDLGPIAMAVENDKAYVSNMHSGSVLTIDMRLPPRKAVIGRLAGSTSKVYYPLGVVIYRHKMYVAEHIHNFMAEYDFKNGVVGQVPERVFSESRDEMNLYGLLADNGNILAASLLPAQIYVFPISGNRTREPSVIMLPDGATITAMARVAYARP